MENKLKNILDFYYTTSTLKDLIRQGAVKWGCSRERLESVAEHVYSTQMLAFAMQTEFNIPIDIKKVCMMLAFHELEEIKIGDITYMDNMAKQEKLIIGNKAVNQVLGTLSNRDIVKELIDEFNTNETLDAKFAKACDKLDNVLEIKKYVEQGHISTENGTPEMLADTRLQAMFEKGITRLDDIWFYAHKNSFEQFGIGEKEWRDFVRDYNCNDILSSKNQTMDK